MRTRLLAVVALLLLGALATACGVKGAPRPPRRTAATTTAR